MCSLSLLSSGTSATVPTPRSFAKRAHQTVWMHRAAATELASSRAPVCSPSDMLVSVMSIGLEPGAPRANQVMHVSGRSGTWCGGHDFFHFLRRSSLSQHFSIFPPPSPLKVSLDVLCCGSARTGGLTTLVASHGISFLHLQTAFQTHCRNQFLKTLSTLPLRPITLQLLPRELC